MNTTAYNFASLEDHPLVSAVYRNLISKNYPHCSFQEFSSTDSLIEGLKTERFDFIFFDLLLDGIFTFNDLEYVKFNYPDIKVLVVSFFEDELYAPRVMSLGIEGYVNKKEPMDVLENAIRSIVSGGIYFKRNFFSQRSTLENKFRQNPFSLLGNREFEICVLLSEGVKIAEISRILNLSPSTVSTHKFNSFKKLNINSIVELYDLAKVYTVSSIRNLPPHTIVQKCKIS